MWLCLYGLFVVWVAAVREPECLASCLPHWLASAPIKVRLACSDCITGTYIPVGLHS